LTGVEGTEYSQGGGTYPNLLDAHPPFQIDGNFGGTSGITEMLLQSHDGAAQLLPALPEEWSNGKVTGLKARGGFTVDITWKNKKVTEVKIHSLLGNNFRIRTDSSLKGKNLKKSAGENNNPFYQSVFSNEPIQGDAKTTPLNLYDLTTQQGGIYILKGM
jgi:alpha-L-fucosidase 2